MIEVGKKAPAFNLQDQDGKKRKLADFAGQWVVLYFYPRDDTPGCTIQARDFSADLAKFKKKGAIVLGCSPDAPESHCKFIAKHDLKLVLLADPTTKTLDAYGAWGEKNLYGKKSIGVIRSTALIDPDGKVAWHWKRATAKGHSEKVLAKLQELCG